MRVLVVYDSRREAGATRAVAECIADALGRMGAEATVCRARGSCPDPKSFDLVVVGAPIYHEYPMRSVLEFIDRNSGLEGLRVAVFITCLAASRRIPAPIRNAATRRYMSLVLKHVRGEVVASRVFKGWLREPDPSVLRECAEWGAALAKAMDEGARRLQGP